MKNISDRLKEIAGPLTRDDKIVNVISDVARRVRVVGLDGKPVPMAYSRAYEIWYGRARRIDQREIDAIAAAADKKQREIARNELHALGNRFAIMEARLASVDADFHRETIDALCEISRGNGRLVTGRG